MVWRLLCKAEVLAQSLVHVRLSRMNTILRSLRWLYRGDSMSCLVVFRRFYFWPMRRDTVKHTFDAQILVDLGPVHTLAISD